MKKCIFLLIALSVFILAQSQPLPAWELTGNSSTNPAINFLGTTDNNPLRFRVANVYAGEIDSVTGKTFFGYGTGRSTTGTGNIGFGFKALYSNTTGAYNTAHGHSTLYSNTTGSNNVANGFQALASNIYGYGNVGIGFNALTKNNGSLNTATGLNALYSNTYASYNTAYGSYALYSTTTGQGNVGTGVSALHYNTTGEQNTSDGYESLYRNTTGLSNSAHGFRSLSLNTTGSKNTAGGTYALYTNTTGINNTASGYNSLYFNTSGWHNSAHGYYSIWHNTTGSFNTAHGYYALAANTTSSYNTSIGTFSLFSTATSDYNTAIGYNAGGNYNLGWNNTMVGAHANANANGSYNCVAIGNFTTTTASNQARIGNSSTNSIGGYANWTNISDGRYKKNVQRNVKGLEFIMKLQPVTYHLDVSGISKKLNENKDMVAHESSRKATAEKEKVLFSGFVAQDVEKAAEETGYDFSGVDKPKNENDFYGLRYAEFVVPLVKAVQEQQQIINELIKQNANLQQRITNLEKNSGIASNPSSIATDVLSVWPNPSNDLVLVSIVADNESRATINIFDTRGSLVKTHHAAIAPGGNQLRIDVKGLASGTYHFSAEWNNGKMKRTVLVIKQ